MSLRDDLRSLLAFHPAPGRWPFAVSVGVAMALPVIIATAAGHAQLGPIASSGSLLAIYLSQRSRRERAWALPLIGAGMLATMAAASLLAAAGTGTAGALAILAIAVIGSSMILFARQAGPPSGLFFALLAGAGSRLSQPVAQGGEGLSPLLVVGMTALGCLIAYVVIVAPLAIPSIRRRDAVLHAETERRRFALHEPLRLLAPRIAIATLIAVAVAVPLDVHRAYWVVLTAVAILQKEPHLRLTAVRAVHRVVGTLLGVGIFWLLALAHPTGYLLGILLGVLQCAAELLVVRNYGVALLVITPLSLLIAEQGAGGDLTGVTGERVLDTLLGAAISALVLTGSWLLRRGRVRTAAP